MAEDSVLKYYIKDWSKFQHFRDRKPPWIKLYRNILDDYQWHGLPPEHAKMLISLWLIASEFDGELPDNSELAFRLRVSTESIQGHLDALSHWICLGDATQAMSNEVWASRYVSKQIREELLESTNYKCVGCSSELRLEIDHIIPISQGGDSSKENLQVLCRSCNRSKRTKTITYDACASAERGSGGVCSLETETETETETDAREEFQIRFEEFIDLYPRQEQIAKARELFMKVHYPHDKIISSLIEQVKFWKTEKTANRYIPLPTNWLKNERWLDTPGIKDNETPEQKAASKQKSDINRLLVEVSTTKTTLDRMQSYGSDEDITNAKTAHENAESAYQELTG